MNTVCQFDHDINIKIQLKVQKRAASCQVVPFNRSVSHRSAVTGSAGPDAHLIPAGRDQLLHGPQQLDRPARVRPAEPDAHRPSVPRGLQDRHRGGTRTQDPARGGHQIHAGQQQSQGGGQTTSAQRTSGAHHQTQDQLLLVHQQLWMSGSKLQ